MSDSDLKPESLPQRLCSEIQLFDLCDLNSCNHKKGRFCTDADLLNRFEKIAEEEIRTPERFVSEDDDNEENEDGGDDFAMDDFEAGEENGWEDEE